MLGFDHQRADIGTIEPGVKSKALYASDHRVLAGRKKGLRPAQSGRLLHVPPLAA